MPTLPSPSVQRLLDALLGATPGAALRPDLARWVTASARTGAFLETNQPKVRRKLRAAADTETLRDLRVELLVAHALLGERRIDVAWEAFGSHRLGPDFTVTLAGLPPFTLEVTRLRRPAADVEPGTPWLGKLRQLPPSVANVLLVAIAGDDAAALDVASSVRAVRARADARDDALFAARGFGDARGFYERFLRLSAVVVLADAASGDRRAAMWPNPSARVRLPDRAARLVLARLRAEA
jgi:hypothetical protein